MEKERKVILKLAQKLTQRIGHKVSVDDPEYWGLACILTDEMAEVALKMKIRKPMTFEEMMKLTNKNREELKPILDALCKCGVVEYNFENEKHEKQYVLPMLVPGSAEFMNMNQEQLKEHPELGRFFERMTYLPLEKTLPMIPPGGAGLGMHVIPVEKAIESESTSIDVEHISHWLKKYDGKYAASPCACRLSRQTFDEGCGDDPESWCIAVGDMADYVVETQKGGRYVTYDEVMEILKKAEDNGFVHQITNIDGSDKIFAICNCNINVCYALRTSQLFNTPNISRSAYTAHVDMNKCVACGKCVEVCPAGAAKLGQKLCTKDGAISYPKHELPDATRWGKEKWDVDYRDKNRINCYDTGTAPCKSACPAHVSVQGYLKKAAEGKYQEALALIKQDNPFPAVCGRICNRRCEDACTRGTIDHAVAIDEVKKFIAQQDLDSEKRYIPPIVTPTMKGGFDNKIAIIGAGPAGLSCAYYLALKGYKPTVFEKNERPGGMLEYGIPAFKLEKDVINAEIDVIKQLGVEIKCGIEVGKDITIQQLREQGYEAFYLAIGCQGSRAANVVNENIIGVKKAVDFLHDVSENHNYKVNDEVVVIGGGNVAIDVARTSIRCDAKKVTIVSLESFESLPASDEEILEAREEGVDFDCGWGIKEIKEKAGKVDSIILKRCISTLDENKRFNPQYDENEIKEIKCQNLFLSIGQCVDLKTLLDNEKVELNPNKTIKADKLTYQTTQKDIFVGGDAYTGPRFAIDAIAQGREGAISIHRFVQPNSSLTIGRNRREFIELDKNNIAIESYDHEQRQKPHIKTDIEYKKSFKDPKEVFSEEQVKKETSRCLKCGATIIDENKCIGCGVCTTKCKFDAITLTRDHPHCSDMYKAEDKMKAILPYAAKRGIKILFNRKGNKK